MLSRIIVLLTALTLGLYAIEGAASLSVAEKEKRFISEEIVVKIDLKSTAFSIKNVKIGLENSDDYIVIAPTSAAFLETIDVNGTDWQVVYYEYKLYPLHAGELEIPPVAISFQASMGYGQPEKEFSFHSEPLRLKVEAPKGVGQNTFVLSTTYYSVKSDISPSAAEGNVTQIKVGDAVTVKISQAAGSVPDILLKPSYYAQNAYFKIYSEEPVLNTKGEGKASRATRRDAYTFIAVKEGNASIPSQTFMWWDPEDEVLHKEVTKAYHFVILPNPLSDVNATASMEEVKKNNRWIYIALFLLILLIVLTKVYPKFEAWKLKKKLAYQESEEGRFKSLLDACQGNDVNALYHTFYTWLEVASPKLSRLGFRGVEEVQPSFSESLNALEAALAIPEQSFDQKHFISEVTKLRERLLKELQHTGQALPSTINPQL